MNITRTQRAPEAYIITESRTVRAASRWQRSNTRSGECISIMPDGATRIMSTTRTRARQRQVVAPIIEDRNARMRAAARTKFTHDYNEQ